MKNRLAILGFALLALIAWVIYKPPGRLGVSVQPSMIPPPVVVSLSQTNIPMRVFPGVSGVLMILPDGSLWRWGRTGGKYVTRAQVPEQVGVNRDWTQAFAANNHCVGLRADGTVWEWGYCGDKQITALPTQIGQDHHWMGVAAGDAHAVALKRDGTVWGWGDNSMQQLGAGLATNEPSPVQIDTNCDWKAISCGQGLHTVALRTDGSLWVWGSISGFENGQPGVVLPVPTRVCRDTNWIGLAAGKIVRAFTKSAVWYALYSPPNPTADTVSICHLISSNSSPAHVAMAFCGWPELYEIRSDGTLWAKIYPIGLWAKARDHWRQIGQRTDWLSVWGNDPALGLTADGIVWTWGSDPGQEPVLDVRSRYKIFKKRAFTWFGLAPTRLTTSAVSPYQKEPRPLIQLVYTPPQ